VEGVGGHVVEVRPVVAELAAAELGAELERDALTEIHPRLELDAHDAAFAAVAEEEEIRLRRVALDEAVDAVVVVEEAELRPGHRVRRRRAR
jgi:hypothetical protein